MRLFRKKPGENSLNTYRVKQIAKEGIDVILYLLVVFILIWILARGTRELGYNWQWYRVLQYVFTVENGDFIPGPLMQGLYLTFKITGISLVLSFVFGLAAASLRLSGSIVGGFFARVYVEVIRNTPLLVQIFFFYFVLSPVLGMGRFTTAVLALSLFEGAYASEIFRAGIVSIDRGQWEAARSIGMNTFQMYYYIILPQAIRRILPPLASQGISLVKDSALVSTIAIYDLTMKAQAVISETYMTFEIWFTVAAIYLLITGSLSVFVKYLEYRFQVHG